MRESFIFYKSFLDALEELPDDLRLKLYDAIATYALKGEEIELSGIEKAVFLLIKPQINANHQKYENGCKGGEFGKLGGRPKKPQENPKEGKKKTPKKPQENPNRTPNENENDNVNENDTPLFISPQSGDEKNNFADKFFAKYPRYAKDRAKFSESYDYKRLLEEFEKSSYLRSLYTAKQVVELYPLIVTGEYRDKEQQPSPTVDADARVERERWYAKRRQEAQSKADRAKRKLLEQYPWYEEYEKGERAAEIALAKAEVAFEKAPSQETEAALEEEKKDLAHYKAQKASVLECAGMTEEDLEPKWNCTKCKDTGFVDGKACDCYEG